VFLSTSSDSVREILSKCILESSVSSLNISNWTKLNRLYLNNCSPLLQVTESFDVPFDVVKPPWYCVSVGFVIASGGHFQMAFNLVDKHSRLKCSVSEKNGIYHIFKAWGSSVGIMTRHRLDTQGSVPSRDIRFFSIPQHPDQLWLQPSPQHNIQCAMVALPLKSSWHSALLSKRTTLSSQVPINIRPP
jgi:hypothetical protein